MSADRYKSVRQSLISILLDGNTEAAFSAAVCPCSRQNGGSGAVATRRASKIDTSSRGRLQAGLPPSRFCIVTPGQATTRTLAAVKTAIRRDKKMSKEELIQFEGLVIEILPDARYRVQLDAGY